MKTVITLGDTERRGVVMLEITCRRCERRGWLRMSHSLRCARSSPAPAGLVMGV
jgi:hypothetical protein